nr:DnaB-like helicase C-terminal domain-containing protein [Candidatus Phytoplasma sacchari]
MILASRPGIGKTTSFMLNMILKVLDHNEHFKIAVFSLEMNNIQLGYRWLSTKTKIVPMGDSSTAMAKKRNKFFLL